MGGQERGDYEEANGALLEVAGLVGELVEGVEAGGELAGENELAELLVVQIGGLPKDALRPGEALLHRPPTGAADPVPHPRPPLPLIKGLGLGMAQGERRSSSRREWERGNF